MSMLVDKSLPIQYAAALALVLSVSGLHILLEPRIEQHLAFGAALLTLLTGWLFRPGPALAALIAGALVTDYLILPPRYSLLVYDLADATGIFTYLLAGTCAIGLFHSLRAERERSRRREAELDASRRRVTGILCSITDCYLRVDNEWRLVELNDQAAQYVGQRREQVLGHHLRDVFRAAPGNIFEEKFLQALQEDRPVHFEADSPLMPGRWAEVHALPLADGLEIYFRDITARRRAQIEIAELNERLQHRVAELQVLFETIPSGTALPRILTTLPSG